MADDEAAEAAAMARSFAGKTTPASSTSKKQKKSKTTVDVEWLGEDPGLTTAYLKLKDRDQTINLRLRLAWFAIIAVSIQLMIANLIFGWYMWANGWTNLPSEIMIAWLSSTVVEVIGIVVIIARNLFPSRDRAVTRRDLMKIAKQLKSDSN